MNGYLRLSACALLIGLIVSYAATALAGPPILPSSFYGLAKIDGVNIPAGMPVTAQIGGIAYAETTVAVSANDAYYTLNVPADDPDTPTKDGGVAGDVITLTVSVGGRVITRTAIWQSGANVRMGLVQYRLLLPIARRQTP